MPTPPNRREFLGYLGLAAGSLAVGRTPTVFGADELTTSQPTTARTPIGEKITIGLIGCGTRGRLDLRAALARNDVQCAAVCDVDSRHIKNAQGDVERVQGVTPEGYRDFRELLARPELDAVIIAVPVHWNALICIEACTADKDAYCEIPLAHNVLEGRAMAAAVAEAGAIIQVGATLRSAPHVQKAIELVRSGALGPIALTESFAAEDDYWTQPLGKTPDTDAPAELDYDLWLGPAPKLPYNEKRCHQYWRWFFDYSVGRAGERHAELFDILQRAMRVDAPQSVDAVGGTHVVQDMRDTYDTLTAVLSYPSFTHSMTYQAVRSPHPSGKRSGLYFHGANGSLFVNEREFEVLPVLKTETVDEKLVETARVAPQKEEAPQPTGDDPPAALTAQLANFFDCVRSRQAPIADVASVHRAAVAVHLANIALKTGRRVTWDAEKQICADASGKPDAAANKLLTREYRAPWKAPLAPTAPSPAVPAETPNAPQS